MNCMPSDFVWLPVYAAVRGESCDRHPSEHPSRLTDTMATSRAVTSLSLWQYGSEFPNLVMISWMKLLYTFPPPYGNMRSKLKTILMRIKTHIHNNEFQMFTHKCKKTDEQTDVLCHCSICRLQIIWDWFSDWWLMKISIAHVSIKVLNVCNACHK